MSANLQRWRQRNDLTQVEAALLLGVSQPYLSLLEKGSRPLTAELRHRLRVVHPAQRRDSAGDDFRAQLSALGYPGFAHVTPSRPRPSPDALLLSVLARPDVDSRVVEALPWLVRRYATQLDLAWLVRQAKLQNLQNRLGFVLQTSGAENATVVQELERARLLEESTLCWDSMPPATRDWMHVNRPALAAHWNVVTTLRPEDLSHAG